MAFDWLPEDIINDLFWLCVNVMRFICENTGISYEALNIWLFVVIQPALILLFSLLWLNERKRRTTGV